MCTPFCPQDALPRIVLPSRFISLPPASLFWESHCCRQLISCAGFTRSNMRRKVSSSGIPSGSSPNVLNQPSHTLPNSSISSKPSPLIIVEHSPMTSMSLSLCRLFPHCRQGSSTALNAVCILRMSASCISISPTPYWFIWIQYSSFWGVYAVALALGARKSIL